MEAFYDFYERHPILTIILAIIVAGMIGDMFRRTVVVHIKK